MTANSDRAGSTTRVHGVLQNGTSARKTAIRWRSLDKRPSTMLRGRAHVTTKANGHTETLSYVSTIECVTNGHQADTKTLSYVRYKRELSYVGIARGVHSIQRPMYAEEPREGWLCEACCMEWAPPRSTSSKLHASSLARTAGTRSCRLLVRALCLSDEEYELTRAAVAVVWMDILLS